MSQGHEPGGRIMMEPVQQDHAAFQVPLAQVQPGRHWPLHWNRDSECLEPLLTSIRVHGILQPLVVRRTAADASAPFEVLAGFRRLAAARQLNLATVPVRVVQATDDEAIAVLLAENVARNDLEPEAMGALIVRLHQEQGWSPRQIARSTGVSVEAVNHALEPAPAPARAFAGAPLSSLSSPSIRAPALVADPVPMAASDSGYVAVAAEEVALAHNLSLVVRQVLSVLEQARRRQGSRLGWPASVRAPLEDATEGLQAFLHRDRLATTASVDSGVHQ